MKFIFKELTIIILLSLALFASGEENLFKDVNQTYSNDMYVNIFKNLNVISIDNFEWAK